MFNIINKIKSFWKDYFAKQEKRRNCKHEYTGLSHECTDNTKTIYKCKKCGETEEEIDYH